MLVNIVFEKSGLSSERPALGCFKSRCTGLYTSNIHMENGFQMSMAVYPVRSVTRWFRVHNTIIDEQFDEDKKA